MEYKFPINGLRHHDFKGRLDELYELAPGRRMSISIEHDNPVEKDAIIVYCGKDFVGYVRSGHDRELAYSIIQASGRGALLGKIVEVDRTARWLWMEVSTQAVPTRQADCAPSVLSDWEFDGDLLKSDESETRLHTMISNLEMTLEENEPWDDDMEQWLEYIEQNLWRDISRETSARVLHIQQLLDDGAEAQQDYRQKKPRLQRTIDAMGSPEVRQMQAMQIMEKANSKEMDLLLLSYGDKAMESIKKLPELLTQLFLKDGEAFMAKLWYLHRPYKQVQAVKTLLAMMVRLNSLDAKASKPRITQQWLTDWALRQKDKAKAEVVREILSTFELEQSNPKLAGQIQQMMDGCNTPAKGDTHINQLNMGDGTQQLPTNLELPKLPKQ